MRSASVISISWSMALILCSSNYLIVSIYLRNFDSCGALLIICQCAFRKACVSRKWFMHRKVNWTIYSGLWNQKIFIKFNTCMTSTPGSPWSRLHHPLHVCSPIYLFLKALTYTDSSLILPCHPITSAIASSSPAGLHKVGLLDCLLHALVYMCLVLGIKI